MVAVFFASTTAQSEELTDVERCAGWGEFATKVMSARQRGVSMSELMAGANEYAQWVIIEAYDNPNFTFAGEEQVLRANREFSNFVQVECYKSLRN